MRIRWHSLWLLGLAVGACSLNPQPELPGDNLGSSSAAGGSNGSGGTASSAAGGANGVAGTGVTEPNGGGFDSGADAGATGSSIGEAGAGGEGPGGQEAGASGEGGALQLAPGPAR